MWNLWLSFLLHVLYSVKAEQTLNIMGLFSVTGENWPGGGACLTAAEMALRHVNERDDILPNFKLNLTWRDGKVSTHNHLVRAKENLKLSHAGPSYR